MYPNEFVLGERGPQNSVVIQVCTLSIQELEHILQNGKTQIFQNSLKMGHNIENFQIGLWIKSTISGCVVCRAEKLYL